MVITKIQLFYSVMANSILVNKKVWIVGLVVIVVVLIAFGISSARATIMEHRTMIMNGNYNHMPQINGSINVRQMSKNFIDDHLKISFLQASEIASEQFQNGTIIGGHLEIVQGYVTYAFHVINAGNQTGYLVLLDAGNGKVLYISTGIPVFEQFWFWSALGDGRMWQ